MMKKVFFGGALLLGLSGVVLSIPEVKTVERSAVVAAPPAAVYAVLNDLKSWNEWVPVRERVVASSTYEEDGAVWKWKMKDGRPFGVRRRSTSPDRVDLEFLEGGTTASQAIVLAPEGAGTRVTWKHSITLVGIPKLAPLWLTPDEVIGPILEENLAALGKRLAP